MARSISLPMVTAFGQRADSKDMGASISGAVAASVAVRVTPLQPFPEHPAELLVAHLAHHCRVVDLGEELDDQFIDLRCHSTDPARARGRRKDGPLKRDPLAGIARAPGSGTVVRN